VLAPVKCSSIARAYVVGVLGKFKSADDDLSNESIVCAYYSARSTGDFAKFLRIGDWALWTNIVVPESIVMHRDVIESFGRLSYYACHRMVHRSWPVYEEIADEFLRIAHNARAELLKQESHVII